MSDRTFRLERLSRSHDRASFSCGVEALDRYLRQYARQDRDRKAVGVFVLLDETTTLIAGYYTLSSEIVELKNLPPDFVEKLPRYSRLGATLIGRLAIDTRYQGQGIGRRLLLDALRRAFERSDEIGAVAVIVDAKDNAARAFYERFGFARFTDDEYRLFLPTLSISLLLPELTQPT
ncbi:MAG TPA: GNAT family N-acetyltransferase [Thermomicrobiales bacterium]|nr:GNAT family N-acetyltransferase [Thermomicrobiales bacterium]